jgi:hypothetical protein
MSTHDGNKWTLGRKVGVGLFTLAVGEIAYGCSGGNLAIAVFAAVIALVIGGTFSDPNMYKSDVELRSTTTAGHFDEPSE